MEIYQLVCVYFLSFLTYSFFGWAWESTLYTVKQKHFVNRGFLVGPYCPIYGTGALLVILLFSRDTANPINLFLSSGVVCCILEYFTSWAMEKLFHARWWDYSKRKFNLNGRICLIGFVCFGLMAVVILEWVEPVITSFYLRMSTTLQIVLSSVLFVGFMVDFVFTVLHAFKFAKRMELLEQEVRAKVDASKSNFEEAVRDYLANSRVTQAIQEFKKEASSWQSRRLLHAFPQLQSFEHPVLFEELRTRIEQRIK